MSSTQQKYPHYYRDVSKLSTLSSADVVSLFNITDPNMVLAVDLILGFNTVEVRKDITHLQYIDVYRPLGLFNVNDPCLQHGFKKLLCAGMRGSKDELKDIRETIATFGRGLEIQLEEGCPSSDLANLYTRLIDLLSITRQQLEASQR